MTARRRRYFHCPVCGEPVPEQQDGAIPAHTTGLGNPCPESGAAR